VDDAIATYFRAWNEQDPDQRRRMLERSVTDDAVLVDPTGRRPLLELRLFEFLCTPCASAPDPLRERLMADAAVGGDRSQRLAGGVPCEDGF
jgi:hypothetical protein